MVGYVFTTKRKGQGQTKMQNQKYLQYTPFQTSDLHNSSKNNNDSDTDMSDFLVGGGCNDDVDMAYSSENDNSGVDNYEMENNLDSFMNNNLWVPNSSQTIYDLNDSEETMNVNVIFGRQYTY